MIFIQNLLMQRCAIPQLVDKGYQLVTIEELAEARGIALQNGEEYYSFYPNEE